MGKNYQTERVRAATGEVVVPDEVCVAMGELGDAMREGLLALAVGAGLQVMRVVMEENVTAICGPKGHHDLTRRAVRHGSEDGSVVLGGRQLPVRRPRVRTADRSTEVAVPAYELFSGTEVLGELALERMLAKLSTRRYRAGLEPVGSRVAAVASGTSRSAVSRRFVAMTERALEEMMHADLSELDLVALMIDGVHFVEHLCVVALGITSDGTKVPLGLVEGSTENATVVRSLLGDLRDRGLDVTRPILVVIDGAKALAAAVREVFDCPAVQRCQLHKIRNVQAHLPKTTASTVAKKMRAA
jgi:putative transposase